jgi:hypothetical protein
MGADIPESEVCFKDVRPVTIYTVPAIEQESARDFPSCCNKALLVFFQKQYI